MKNFVKTYEKTFDKSSTESCCSCSGQISVTTSELNFVKASVKSCKYICVDLFGDDH